MSTFTKIATTGALSAMLATAGLGAAPAQAGDHGGAGLAIGLATGLIVGGILLNQHHRRYQPQANFYYDNAGYDNGPVCHLGPNRVHLVQECLPGGYCRTVERVYRDQYCN